MQVKFAESMIMTVLVKSTDGRRAYVYGANKPVQSYITRLFGKGSIQYLYDDYSRAIVSPDQFDHMVELCEYEEFYQCGYVTIEILDLYCTPYPTC